MRTDCESNDLLVANGVSAVAHVDAISPEQIFLTAIKVVGDIRRDARNRLQCATSFSHSRAYRAVMKDFGVEHLYRGDASESEKVIGVMRRITMAVIAKATQYEDDDSFNSGVSAIDPRQWV